MTDHTKAIELFKRFMRKYPRIQMMPAGFGGITEAGRFYLHPVREGKILKGHNTVKLKFPYLDLSRARLNFRTDFGHAKGSAAPVQQSAALWKKLQGEYFADRRFTIEIVGVPHYYSVGLADMPLFAAKFRVWRKMRGLVLDPAPHEQPTHVHWSAFVPEGTPEHAAIQAAIEYEHASKLHFDPPKGTPPVHSMVVEQAEQVLRAKLATLNI